MKKPTLFVILIFILFAIYVPKNITVENRPRKGPIRESIREDVSFVIATKRTKSNDTEQTHDIAYKYTQLARESDIPNVHVPQVNCGALFKGDEQEQSIASGYKVRSMEDERDLIGLASNCDRFKEREKFILKPISDEEANFPIAFSILMYKDPNMVTKLLRAIYRPQNSYCIHIDKKSSAEIHQTMAAIANCFPNVIISSISYDVKWGGITNLLPELSCMADLWKFKSWKYFINLTGQEFPLKTNWDIVKYLKTLNGSNDSMGYVREDFKKRYKGREHMLKDNITLTKGSVLVAVQRGFVDFVLHNPIAARFLEWVKETKHPDETYFVSLSHSPQLGVPGAHSGDPSPNVHGEHHESFIKFYIWNISGRKSMKHPCHGRIAHQLCIFGVKELPLLASRPEMFANKFHWDSEPLAYDCMQERYFNLTRAQLNGYNALNTSLYSRLDYVVNHVHKFENS